MDKLVIKEKCDLNPEFRCLFRELYLACSISPPNRIAFSQTIRRRLEMLSLKDRQNIVSCTVDDCSPLFIACKNDNVELVNYLLDVCGADVEQLGIYRSDEVHTVSPLWCASVCGNLDVVKSLIDHGAYVNSVSNTGSTAVRSACYKSHYKVVKFLIENNANLHKANDIGGTCLINAIKNTKLCKLLLIHGVDVNAQDQRKNTALHYAIELQILETVKILVCHEADVTTKNKSGNDALQLASLVGACLIVEYLVSIDKFSHCRIAEAYELLGCTFLDKYNDIAVALMFWRKAILYRDEHDIGIYRCIQPPRETFKNITEMETIAKLHDVIYDVDCLRMISLLGCERILGPLHGETISLIISRGYAYSANKKFDKSIKLLIYAVYLLICKEHVISSKTCCVLENLIRSLFINIQESKTNNEISTLEFCDIFKLLNLVCHDICHIKEIIKVRPISLLQSQSYDVILEDLVRMLFLMCMIDITDHQLFRLKKLICWFLSKDVRSSNGDTILHLSVKYIHDRSVFNVGIEWVDKIETYVKFIRLLVECDCNIDARDRDGNSVLHLACHAKVKNQSDVLKLFLDCGAHVDLPNNMGITAMKLLRDLGRFEFCQFDYVNLQCLAARTIRKYNVEYDYIVHKNLKNFIELH